VSLGDLSTAETFEQRPPIPFPFLPKTNTLIPHLFLIRFLAADAGRDGVHPRMLGLYWQGKKESIQVRMDLRTRFSTWE
jgi:hypothetical protein